MSINSGILIPASGGGGVTIDGNEVSAFDVNNGLTFDAGASLLQLGGDLVKDTLIVSDNYEYGIYSINTSATRHILISAIQNGISPDNMALQLCTHYSFSNLMEGVTITNDTFNIAMRTSGARAFEFTINTTGQQRLNTGWSFHSLGIPSGSNNRVLVIGQNVCIGDLSVNDLQNNNATEIWNLYFKNSIAAPTKNDTFRMYAANATADGDSAPHFMTEDDELIVLYPFGIYNAPTGDQARQTFDPSTVTLEELAEIVAALITDIGQTGLIKVV